MGARVEPSARNHAAHGVDVLTRHRAEPSRLERILCIAHDPRAEPGPHRIQVFDKNIVHTWLLNPVANEVYHLICCVFLIDNLHPHERLDISARRLAIKELPNSIDRALECSRVIWLRAGPIFIVDFGWYTVYADDEVIERRIQNVGQGRHIAVRAEIDSAETTSISVINHIPNRERDCTNFVTPKHR